MKSSPTRDNGKIAATVEYALAQSAQGQCCCGCGIRQALPMKSVIVNGRPWTDFDPAKEAVRLHDVKGSVKVEVGYWALNKRRFTVAVTQSVADHTSVTALHPIVYSLT